MTRLDEADRRRVEETLARALVALESGEPEPARPGPCVTIAGHPAQERASARALAAGELAAPSVVMRQRPSKPGAPFG